MEPTAIQNRTPWIDFLRGVLITFIVIGHGKSPFTRYIFWFHVPAFFMLSGYLFKPVTNTTELKQFIVKKTKSLLIPYIVFLALFVSIRCVYNLGINPHFDVGLEIKNALYGGRVILGVYSAFWFITCFYAVQILYATITLFGKKLLPITLMVLTCYLLAHLESYLMTVRGHLRPIPLNLDVALLGVAYFHIGYLFKYIEEIYLSKKILLLYTTINVVLCSTLIYASAVGSFQYELNLKSLGYYHLFLDAIVPVIFTLALVGVSYFAVAYDTKKVFSTLGRYSLPIMYTHFGIGLAFQAITDINWILYTVVALPLSFAAGYILDQSEQTQFLFLGKI